MTAQKHSQRSPARLTSSLLALALGGLLGGCGGPDTPTPPSAPEKPAMLEAPAANAEVIARVNGHPITRARFEAALAKSDAGTSRQATLDALIDLELLAQAAIERGLDDQPQLIQRKKQATVQRLLAEAIEAPTRAEALPADLVRSAYDQFALDVFEPELVTASHLILELPKAEQTPEKLAAARALAADFIEELRALPSPIDPKALDLLQAAATLRGYLVEVDQSLTFPRHPLRSVDGQPPRFQAMVEPFASAAFELSEAHRISDPVTSEFGVHIILFLGRRAEVRPPFESVKAAITDKLVRAARHRLYNELMGSLEAKASIAIDEAPLEEMARQLFQQKAPPAAPLPPLSKIPSSIHDAHEIP